MVHEQRALEVIHLVLQADRQQPLGLDLAHGAGLVEIARAHAAWARDLGVMLGQRQTALLEGHPFLRCPDDLRIGHAHRRALAVLLGHVEDDDAQGLADLRRRQPDPRGGVHRLEHVVHEAADPVVDGDDRPRLGLQPRIGRDEDFEQSHDAFT
jgi:hypothetical protein